MRLMSSTWKQIFYILARIAPWLPILIGWPGSAPLVASYLDRLAREHPLAVVLVILVLKPPSLGQFRQVFI